MGKKFSSPSRQQPKPKNINIISQTIASATKTVSVKTNSKYYDTNHKNYGVALIFNHYTFKTMAPREGTHKDRDDLKKVLEDINFDVRVHNDLKYKEIMEVLAKTADEDHSNNDCIVIVMMTHGDVNQNLYACDKTYLVGELWNRFMGKNCPSLIGKPKLVFIQACRGEKLDSGCRFLEGDPATDYFETSPTLITYNIPQMADLLVMYSTFEGHYAWINSANGSWFIQALCSELSQNWNKEDLITILTSVSRQVAYDCQSNRPQSYTMDCMKQIPCITSMLTKTLYFTKKVDTF